jgi:hypothetical protein
VDDAGAWAAVSAAGAAPYATINVHKLPALALALSPAGSTAGEAVLASSSADGAGTVLALAVAPGAIGLPRASVAGSAYVPAHAGGVTAVRFTRDGQSVLAMARLDSAVVVFAVGDDAMTWSEAAAACVLCDQAPPKAAAWSDARPVAEAGVAARAGAGRRHLRRCRRRSRSPYRRRRGGGGCGCPGARRRPH